MASIFMKLGDIDGEGQEDNHKKWVEVENASWGHHRSVMPGAKASQRSRGETTLQDIQITSAMHKGSCKIQQNCASGKVEKEVIIHFCRTGEDPSKGLEVYYEIKLQNVMITSYSTAIQGEEVPFENYGLDFTKVEMEYKEADTSGKLSTASSYTWDKEKATAA